MAYAASAAAALQLCGLTAQPPYEDGGRYAGAPRGYELHAATILNSSGEKPMAVAAHDKAIREGGFAREARWSGADLGWRATSRYQRRARRTDAETCRATARAWPRHFFGVITLDATRPGPQISQIAQAIIAELSRVGGTKVTLKLDIDAEAPADFPSDVVDVVNANAKTLKFEQSGFS
jgi:hypothetical protein